MKTKFNKEGRNLLIGLLIGNGTICSNNIFKLSHSLSQKEYLEWKIKLLNEYAIKNNGIKEYTSSCGYNIGKEVVYTQLKTIPFIKVLRRIFYKPKKIIANIKMLNRLTEREIAIWYMDDGCVNIRKTKNKIHGFYIKISTCVNTQEIQILIDYFKEKWNINFYKISEGRNKYSLCCGTKEGIKFINLVYKYVLQVKCMNHKIPYIYLQRISNNSSSENEMGGTYKSEDIV